MIRDSKRLILHSFIKNAMSCDSCGHPRMAHKETTLSVYFCNQCQKIESHVTFIPEKKAEKSEGPEDLLSELYWNYKAFRRSTPFTTS
jgi:ribosomal protein L37AE/L43A